MEKELIEACESCNFEKVKYLVENGANIHAGDEEALRFTSWYGHFEIVKFLVEKGADIHAQYDSALREASYCGHFHIVKFLVENGADIHVWNDRALRDAGWCGHYEIIKYLVGKGANIYVLNNSFVNQPWSLKYLIDYGVNRNIDQGERCIRYLEWIDKIKNKKAIKIQRYWQFRRNKKI